MTIFGQPFFIICSRWVRVMLKSFYERGIVYSSNGSSTANSVKLILGVCLVLNVRQKITANPNILGVASIYQTLR